QRLAHVERSTHRRATEHTSYGRLQRRKLGRQLPMGRLRRPGVYDSARHDVLGGLLSIRSGSKRAAAVDDAVRPAARLAIVPDYAARRPMCGIGMAITGAAEFAAATMWTVCSSTRAARSFTADLRTRPDAAASCASAHTCDQARART